MSKHVCVALCTRGDLWNDPANAELLLVCEPLKEGGAKTYQSWQLPGGKCCDTMGTDDCCMETPEETVIREFREETGFECMVEALSLERTQRSSIVGKFRHYVYRVSITGGSPCNKKTMGSFVSPTWFKLSELPLWMMYRNHVRIVERLLGPYMDKIQAAA